MKQWTFKDFSKILINNGYHVARISGGHYIFKNGNGNHISIPYRNIQCVIAKRLIKENNLNINL